LGIQKVQLAVKACRHQVEAFSRSWKKKRALKKKQNDLELPNHDLIHDVVTRWDSTFKIVSRFLEQQQPISSVLADDWSSWALMPKEHHVTTLEKLRQLLSPLNDFEDALASEKRVTMSAVKPIMEHIIGEILLIDGADLADTKAMKQAIRGDLEARYSEKTKQMMEMCCFLNPRFKESFCVNIDERKKACIGEAMKILPPTAAHPWTEETSVLLPPTTSCMYHIVSLLFLCKALLLHSICENVLLLYKLIFLAFV
jgi:hypothetical protein